MKIQSCITLLTLLITENSCILVNVALGKKTEQLGGQKTWPSSNAVDGVKECQNINGKYLTLSGVSDLPWWKLDLGGLFQIHQVNVFGRNDDQVNQLQGFRLYLSRDRNFTDSIIVYNNTAKDYDHGVTVTTNLSGLFQFIKLDLPGTYRDINTGPIVLCEVEILVEMSNIATDKQATMSTHYGDMTADKCIDGNPRRDANYCDCCSHSSSEGNPWITVDLLQVHEIFQIHVAGRNDDNRTNRDVTGLKIFANGTHILYPGNYTSANASDVVVTLPQGILSQNITLRRPRPQAFTEWYLVVCEVEIYTRYCKAGTYGNVCEQQCGHCRQGSCKSDSGYCPHGECMAGWTGLDCKTECDLGRYGINCSSVCSSHCFNDVSQCNKTTGHCMQGCEAGYMGYNCSMECTAGTFGRDCRSTCTNNCLQGFGQCSKVSGECQRGCVSGFKGLNCSTPCETGRFGVNCTSYCSIHCYDGIEQCNKSSGICKEGCDASFMGTNCSTVCPDGQYGRDCTGTCSDHCKNGKAACNKSTGYCTDSCKPGFTGPKCLLECPQGTFGVNCSGQCHCQIETNCRQTDGHCSSGCAFGWSGFNCSNDLNIIERIRQIVSTNQSSIFSPWNDYDSRKAIDGVQNYSIDHCKCCSVTNGTSPSWWQIDLKQKYLLGGLQIFGRESGANEQLEHAIIYAGNYSTTVNPSVNMTTIYKVPNMTTKRHFTKKLVKPIIAQFVLVHLAQRVMTLCELKLYEKECDIGYFGTGCTHKCHCEDNRACNQVTGKCQTPGCLAGWQGVACENVCDVRKFGDRCNNTCNCINDTLCDNTNGTCFTGQCDPGWRLPTCSEPCDHGHFGEGCNQTCHCKDNTGCDHISGYCDIGLCDPGWLLPKCSEACSYRTFGDNCSSTCHCHDNTSCSSADGICDANTCEPGWMTSSCDKICDHSSFGYNCSSICHCINNTNCNSTTGHCFVGLCESGWQGERCDQACDYRTFGNNCSATCHCFDNTSCNSTTGECYTGLCDSGWQGQNCDQVCDRRSFGYNCSSTCHCDANTNCNSTTGNCFVGLCESGWQGQRCDRACDYRTFGYNCSATCHCFDNTSCSSTSGECHTGVCDSGWRGLKCDKVCEHRSFGYNCSSICHCADNTSCNGITGDCDIGKCDSGWQGLACDQACDHRSFGLNCSSTCHCFKNTTCNSTTGECSIGSCDYGWQGSSCHQATQESANQSNDSSAAVAGGTAAAGVLVVLGVVIGLVLFRRMHLAKKNSTKETKFSHLDKALEEKTNVQRRTRQHAHVNRSYEAEQETSMTATDASEYYSFSEQFMGIRIHELWDYIHTNMENNCEQLISEFKALPQGLVHAYASADHISNRGKNRYKEMYAYDHTRVILDRESNSGDDKPTDYINACYIDGYEKVKKFVASQGPTKNMVDDFWEMVWQLKSDKIVMLTNLIEMGTRKCLQYWPKEEEGETECLFGDIVVKLQETQQFLDYNIRVFWIGKNGKPSRRIRQFHFKSWPDKDVPDSTWCLVNFWRVVDTNDVSNAGPIVVHCSAGVGRTGTFIGLDNMVNQARQEGCIRPLQIVQTLRSQRVNMVQTKEQYVYLHEAVADAMYFGTHVIWTKQFRDVLEFMIQKDKGDARTRLHIQFELIEKSIENPASDVADSPEYSNVETLLSESDAYRPKMKKRGSQFVEQLDAMYIPNYKEKSTFLVSMSPGKDTMEEFWSLVDDNKIKTIIMLTEESSTCYQSSCELGSSSKGGSIFSVNKIEEKIRRGYTQRTFTFKDSGREEEDHLTTVKQFEYTAWKDGLPSPDDTTSFLDMTDAVLKWQPHLSESQPVLVFCGDGCTRSGIICVLLNELQRMKYEGGHVNIVESVKMMKKRHRHLIGSYEQYKFCFDLIMDHIKRTDVYQNL